VTADACVDDLSGGFNVCAPGVAVGGFCWFVGGTGADCNSTCAAQGRVYDEATRTYAGSDGTNANCEAVLMLLVLRGR
jgi:hypothetical protein